jgi:hypothetical protein
MTGVSAHVRKWDPHMSSATFTFNGSSALPTTRLIIWGAHFLQVPPLVHPCLSRRSVKFNSSPVYFISYHPTYGRFLFDILLHFSFNAAHRVINPVTRKYLRIWKPVKTSPPSSDMFLQYIYYGDISLHLRIPVWGERVFKLGGCFECDFEIEVTIMKNELCSVLRSTDQNCMMPGHEYEELRGL